MTYSLPRPRGRQKEVLCLPEKGHTVVLGTAGSGKTTIALLRGAYLATKGTDHCGNVLLLTFNRCLVSYLKSQATGLPSKLKIENYHKFARGYLHNRGKMKRNCICNPTLRNKLCRTAVEKTKKGSTTEGVLDRPIQLFEEEFRWIAQHGITDIKEYITAERIGRAGTRIIRADRPKVFLAYQRYLQLRQDRGKMYDWDDIATAVFHEFKADPSQRHYRHIIVDEGQDFSPMMLRSLAAAVPDNGSLTFFGDMAQQIYGNRMSWRNAGLQVTDVWNFEENYRNSKQIAQLALALSETEYFQSPADLVEPKSPTADGPLPALVSCSSVSAEKKFVSNQAVRLSEIGTVAVLFRNREQERDFSAVLPAGSIELSKNLRLWPSSPGIFHGTYHSAKGLEFDAVILPILHKEKLPPQADISAFGYEDAAARDANLLYVAVTRAKSTLILTHNDQLTDLLPKKQELFKRSSFG